MYIQGIIIIFTTMTDLNFRSCTVLLSSSPVIEASKLPNRELILDSISTIEVPASMCILMTFCHTHHYNYVATGDVIKFNYYHTFHHHCIIIIESLTKYTISILNKRLFRHHSIIILLLKIELDNILYTIAATPLQHHQHVKAGLLNT